MRRPRERIDAQQVYDNDDHTEWKSDHPLPVLPTSDSPGSGVHKADLHRHRRSAPIPSHRGDRDRRSTASTAARLGARSANLGQTAHYSQVIAHFVDRRSRTDRVGPVGWPRPERRRSPHRSPGLRGVAGCPAPTAIAEQLHVQHDWGQAGPCQPSVGVVGRSVGEAAVALATVAGCQPGEGGVTAATGDTHRSSPVTPSGRRRRRPARRGGRMVRTQPRPSLRAGARWDQRPLTSALRQADPARVVGNKSGATALGDFQPPAFAPSHGFWPRGALLSLFARCGFEVNTARSSLVPKSLRTRRRNRWPQTV